MAILIPAAFVAGVIVAVSPCVLPVLPIVLAGGGAAGTRRRPYAIVAGLVATFAAFLLAGAWLWGLLGIDPKYQLKIGAALLLLLALTLIVPRIGEVLERPFLFLTRRRVGDAGGGLLLGASLGLVFVPCTGPILGTLIPLVGAHRSSFDVVLLVLVFSIGLAAPLLAIATGSRRAAASLRANGQTIRIAAGVVVALMAVVLYNGWAARVQTAVPGYVKWAQDLVEGNHSVKRELAQLREGDRSTKSAASKFANPSLAVAPARLKVPLTDYGAAQVFQGISSWVNTPGLSLGALHGKVVLVDFWTYSCINCLRTLPHLEEWNRLYRARGLVIVGVHTPEFDFEHDAANVRDAVARLGVRYPVAIDNGYKTWNAYQNQYWPAEYLIDQNGHVRHIHFGEGEYGATENDIRLLLRAGGQSSLPIAKPERDMTPTGDITPETYLGYSRIDRYSGTQLRADAETTYTAPATLARDHFAYDGQWKVESERIVAGSGARIKLHFHARKVHLVLGGHGFVHVFVDGRPRGAARVDGPRLYTLVSSPSLRDGVLQLKVAPGVEAYAFTFG